MAKAKQFFVKLNDFLTELGAGASYAMSR